MDNTKPTIHHEFIIQGNFDFKNNDHIDGIGYKIIDFVENELGEQAEENNNKMEVDGNGNVIVHTNIAKRVFILIIEP